MTSTRTSRRGCNAPSQRQSPLCARTLHTLRPHDGIKRQDTPAQGSVKNTSAQEVALDCTMDNEDFDRGFMFSATGNTRKLAPNADRATLMIYSGALKTILDDPLIPGLKDSMKE